ncbi:PepSY-associated TM helix domain-containing protein [Pokkaliibacter sp. MBI-7]|uniref:PepSY-associated TM helix domain-containing protein n=1 Tax=Pokkaliibacter sp. MBI-7 TaxID=3040600 RepID=UPI00244B56D0|nr:PepSY-associated TM helix domain-containing protein [Pokkaliibacter sp. MBI-7]MDH2432080.1 PepSY-associated TM helix domain-containing protein [Pokkaliibacter sp. MBI-7]
MRAYQPQNFRRAMSWLHSWTGLLLGWVLFAVFVTGTLSFFQREITLWMQPELQVDSQGSDGIDTALAYLQQHAAAAKRWSIDLPDSRGDTLQLTWGNGERRHDMQRVALNPATGEELFPRQTAGGNFFVRFHYELYGLSPRAGNWIVGIATLFMFVALITGIIIHRQIFKDFFTFRANKGARSWQDGHNATGVLILPFFLMITFSGLLLLGTELLPAVEKAMFGDSERGMHGAMHRHRGESGGPEPVSSDVVPMTDLHQLVAAAQAAWPVNGVQSISISNPNTAQAEVEIAQGGSTSLSNRGMPNRLRFNGVTGEPLNEDEADDRSWVSKLFFSFEGLHLGVYAMPVLRWLLFVSGLFGCVVIASGLVLWVATDHQKLRPGQRKPFALRLLEVLNVGSIAGILIGLAVYFWANRLLPVTLENRRSWEINLFLISWGLTYLHALLRTHQQAWVEQLSLAGALTLTLPVLNGMTGGMSLLHSLSAGQWQVASFDLCALLLGGMYLYAAQKTHGYQPRPATARPQASRITNAEQPQNSAG